MTPTNAYFDTYQKMNTLMGTLSNTNKKTGKPSLKRPSNLNITVASLDVNTLRGSGLDSIHESTYGESHVKGMKSNRSTVNASPLSREIAKAKGLRDS